MTATETTKMMTDMFTQATDGFNKTMSTGIEFQQQVGKFWGDAFGGSFGQGFDDFRTQFEKMGKEAAPTARKNLEQFHHMFDEQSKQTLDSLRRTFEVGTNFDTNTMLDQTMKMWQNSFDTMRSNVDAMAKANVEMLDGMCSMTQKNCATNGQKTQQGKSSAK